MVALMRVCFIHTVTNIVLHLFVVVLENSLHYSSYFSLLFFLKQITRLLFTLIDRIACNHTLLGYNNT